MKKLLGNMKFDFDIKNTFKEVKSIGFKKSMTELVSMLKDITKRGIKK